MLAISLLASVAYSLKASDARTSYNEGIQFGIAGQRVKAKMSLLEALEINKNARDAVNITQVLRIARS